MALSKEEYSLALTREVNLAATQSTTISAEVIRELGGSFKSLIAEEKAEFIGVLMHDFYLTSVNFHPDEP